MKKVRFYPYLLLLTWTGILIFLLYIKDVG